MKLDNWAHVFEDALNSDQYFLLILYPVIDHLNEDNIICGCFQQDGTAVYTAHVPMVLLCDVFGE
jgi:hypothetical protein